MTEAELFRALAMIGVPARDVVVGEAVEQCWCLLKQRGRWLVFWMERGNRNMLSTFNQFEEAAFFLLGKLTYSQILASAGWLPGSNGTLPPTGG